MADFLKAHKRTGVNEGGYANNPRDKGKETWRGIARNYHPNWPGWIIVDQIKPRCKSIKELNAALFANQELNNLVDSFYKNGFWDVNQLDKFASQLLAENVFDAGVHCGPTVAARFLQKALGVEEDGKIGNQTLSAMANASGGGEQKIVDAYASIRKAFYLKLVEKDPSQKVFLNNWLSRADSMRKAVA